jgi:hypothetical protein
MTVLFCGLLLTACGKSNFQWKGIAETTIAELTKADANFKINIENDDAVPQEIIVDGNKMKNADAMYWAKYESLENNLLYLYLPYGDVWYRSPSVLGEGNTLTVYEQHDDCLDILKRTLQDIDNVKYAGGNKYTYRYVAEDSIAGIAEDGYDPVFDYTFITDGTRVTEIHLRGTVQKITYGGQTVTLPNATEPTKLPAPQNLAIHDGILSWDAVPGASEYYVTIYMSNSSMTAYDYRGAQYETGTTMNLLERLQNQPDIFTSGSYQITVKAIFPVFPSIYNSPESAPITYKTASDR